MVTRDYETDEITVHWDSSRCIHTGICLRAQPAVFDVRRRPWIEVDAASASEVAAAVARCPTGALTFSSPTLEEPVPERTVMRPIRGGPMVVRGEVEIVDSRGETVCRTTRATLCRCGGSRNQPFCDNSHRDRDFDEPPLRAPEPEVASPDDICPPQPGFAADA